MNRKPLETPEINPAFTHGEIIDWKFNPSITPAKGKYCFRFSLTFADGTEEPRQVGGFSKKSECLKERERVIAQLHNHEYVAFPKATVKEYLDFWLYVVMIKQKKIAYGTYTAYRNIIYNYLVPYMGKSRLSSVNRGMLAKLLKTIDSPSIEKQMLGVIWGAFNYAKGKNFIGINPAIGITRTYKEAKAKRPAVEKPRPSLTLEQAIKFMLECKEKEPGILLPLFFAITMGMRISEIIALKYTDIDFGTNEAHIQRQLGRKVDEDVSSVQEGMLIKQELSPKTYSGDRITPVPQFVIDEIILEREKYELRKGKVIDFQDYGYIWCKENGSPFNRGSYKKPFKRLLAECGFPDMHWHDSRHTYATILSENNLSLKSIASAMGHSKEIFTADTYTNPQQIITDGLSAIQPFLEEVLPSDVTETLAIDSISF